MLRHLLLGARGIHSRALGVRACKYLVPFVNLFLQLSFLEEVTLLPSCNPLPADRERGEEEEHPIWLNKVFVQIFKPRDRQTLSSTVDER